MRPIVLLSIPNLRDADLGRMPRMAAAAGQTRRELHVTGPALTCPVHATLTTAAGVTDGPAGGGHGVIGNGFYWPERREVEMWTAWDEAVTAPRWWDGLRPRPTAALWFPMLAKGCSADLVCTPAPIHNPDGSESLWCYTKPEALYGELRDRLGHFPLKHFWGPLASIESSRWIVDSAIDCVARRRPEFLFVYLPHLDYAAQKFGPDAPEAADAAAALDVEIGRLVDALPAAYGDGVPAVAAVSEYAITSVERVHCPNRVLRDAGLLAVTAGDDGERIDFARTPSWALADHQIAHVFVDGGAASAARVADAVRDASIAAAVLTGRERGACDLDHVRAGDVVLLARPEESFAYPWWRDDDDAPGFARTVDIHRKPGYDPVELFFDPATKSIPLDPSLVKGSHGLPSSAGGGTGVFLCSDGSVGPPSDAVVDHRAVAAALREALSR